MSNKKITIPAYLESFIEQKQIPKEKIDTYLLGEIMYAKDHEEEHSKEGKESFYTEDENGFPKIDWRLNDIGKIKNSYLTPSSSNKILEEFFNIRLENKYFSSEKAIPQKNMAKIYLNRTKELEKFANFFLSGKTGIGKSYCTFAFCNEMILKHNMKIAYINLMWLYKELLSNNEISKECDEIAKVADIIYIDEFSVYLTNQKKFQWKYDRLYEIVLDILNNSVNKKIIINSIHSFSLVKKLLQTYSDNAFYLKISSFLDNNFKRENIIEII